MIDQAAGAPKLVLRAIRRALKEFLGVPLAVVAAFVALAAAAYAVDAAVWNQGAARPPLLWLTRMLGDAQAISSLLGTIASGMITVTSITFSLLLIAVQQSASALTNQVFDQFIRRWSNRFNFGFFVGLSIYLLLTLATASQDHRPILGTVLALVLAAAALCMVVILIYGTIDQMRPFTIVRAIHDHTAASWQAHRRLLARTRRSPSPDLAWTTTLRSGGYGVVGAIDLDRIEGALRALERAQPPARAEVAFRVAVGDRIAFRDPMLQLAADHPLTDAVRDRLAAELLDAVALEPRRTLDDDPGFGIQQLFAIAWTTTSTAKQNPQPGILVCHSLRDLIARWVGDGPAPEDPEARVVYPDRVVGEAVAALESIAVVASEGMQDRVLGEVLDTLAILIADVPGPVLPDLERVVLRTLSGLGDHVLTGALEESLAAVEAALRQRGLDVAAEAVRGAVATLARSVGRLNSRSTRVPAA